MQGSRFRLARQGGSKPLTLSSRTWSQLGRVCEVQMTASRFEDSRSTEFLMFCAEKLARPLLIGGQGVTTVKRLITTLIFGATLLAGSSAFAGQVSIGIQIGAPPPPPRVVRVLPRRPGPEFVWVDGYWFPQGNHYRWRDGYWARMPYEGARWIAPRYVGRTYYEGYWVGDRRFERDRRWDRDHDRDRWDHDRDRRDRRDHDRY